MSSEFNQNCDTEAGDICDTQSWAEVSFDLKYKAWPLCDSNPRPCITVAMLQPTELGKWHQST